MLRRRTRRARPTWRSLISSPIRIRTGAALAALSALLEVCVQGLTIWVVPSVMFNRMAYRHEDAQGLTLAFRAYPDGDESVCTVRILRPAAALLLASSPGSHPTPENLLPRSSGGLRRRDSHPPVVWPLPGHDVTRTESTSWHRPSASTGSTIDIRSVIDRDYLDESLAIVNSVDHPVWTAPRAPEALELKPQRFAHSLRRIRDMVNRLQYCRGCRCFESIEAASCRRHYLDPPTVRGHPRRRLMATSSIGIPCPPSASFKPLRTFAMSRLSDRMARVSSRLSRSSGLIKTRAGRPLRVTTIRSCCFSTRSATSEKCALTAASGIVSLMTRIIVMFLRR